MVLGSPHLNKEFIDILEVNTRKEVAIILVERHAKEVLSSQRQSIAYNKLIRAHGGCLGTERR